MRSLRWLMGIAGLMAIMGVLAGGRTPAMAENKIVIYAAEDEKTHGALTKLFTEKTGIDTEAIRMPAAGTLVARIRAEKDAPKADVFIGGSIEFHQPLATEGLVVPYRLARGRRRPRSTRSSSARTITGMAGSWALLVIILNPAALRARNRAEGRRQAQDLGRSARPRLREDAGQRHPASCGGAYIFMAVQIFRNGGEDQGFDWLKRYDKQVAAIYARPVRRPITLVARGEVIAGMTWQDDAVDAMHVQAADRGDLPARDRRRDRRRLHHQGRSEPGGREEVRRLPAQQGRPGIKTQLGHTYPVRDDVDPPQGRAAAVHD